MSLVLASIHVYPVKSLGGYRLDEALLTERGLQHDRRWMLVNTDGGFMTQRELPAMACLHTTPLPSGFRVTDTRDGGMLDLPWTMEATGTRMASVWSDRVRTETLDPAWSAWFTRRLGAPLTLVHMPDSTKRRTDGRYAAGLTSLSDGFPYLITSQASLDDLNARLQAPVGMDRFRPNLVIAGGSPYQEDGWRGLQVGGAHFTLAKPCARCVMTTIDQHTGGGGSEPLRTLAGYRNKGNKVLFGMNAVGDPVGMVRTGDLVHPLDRSAALP